MQPQIKTLDAMHHTFLRLKEMKKNRNKKSFLFRLLSLVVVVLILSAAAISKDGKILGYEIQKLQAKQVALANNDTITKQPDGSMIVNTQLLARDIQGYGGPVALRIYINKVGIVSKIEAMPNSETPDFFDQAKTLFAQWQGKPVNEAKNEKVDAVSGATFSSKAIIANMSRGLAYAAQKMESAKQTESADSYGLLFADGKSQQASGAWTIGGIAAIIVALMGAIIPIYYKSRRWRNIQLVLNVIVLGLWTGTFVSYTLLLRLFTNGMTFQSLSTLAASLIVVAVALLYPLFGRKGHYCAHICPFGSAQELAGKLTHRKVHLSPRQAKFLGCFRIFLWAVLMVLMLTTICTAWIDYELFTAFLFTSAPIGVTIAAILFLILSIWVPRPYCRFVCPTGTLLKL